MVERVDKREAGDRGNCFRSGPCGCYAVRASHSPNPTPAARANYWEFWSGGEEQFPLAFSGEIWYNIRKMAKENVKSGETERARMKMTGRTRHTGRTGLAGHTGGER